MATLIMDHLLVANIFGLLVMQINPNLQVRSTNLMQTNNAKVYMVIQRIKIIFLLMNGKYGHCNYKIRTQKLRNKYKYDDSFKLNVLILTVQFTKQQADQQKLYFQYYIQTKQQQKKKYKEKIKSKTYIQQEQRKMEYMNNKQVEQINKLEQFLSMKRMKLTPTNNEVQKQLESVIKQIKHINQLVNKSLIVSKQSKQRVCKDKNIKYRKIPLYYFQLLNLIVININQDNNKTNHYLFKQLNPEMIKQNFRIYVQIQKKCYQTQFRTYKNFLIFLYNLIKRISATFIQSKQQLYIIFQILSLVLQCYFNSHSTQQIDKPSNKQQEKVKQAKFNQQTQWIAAIFQLLPTQQKQIISTNQQNNYNNSFIRIYFNTIKNKSVQQRYKCQYQLLHMIGNFMSLVIQSRTTTQLIKGYQSPLKDIQQMYSKPNHNKLCNIKLHQQDILFVSQLLIQYYKQLKQLFVQFFSNKQQTILKAQNLSQNLVNIINQTDFQLSNPVIQYNESQTNTNLYSNQITLSDLILQTINILNSALFLGGYNHALQLLIYHQLFKDNILPQFLELFYLIYNQRRFMGKHSVKVLLAKPPDANLSELLDINYQSITKQQRLSIFKLISKQIKYGQLSVLLRLLTNLIHINKQALAYFQSNVKYLHMIMSLTHQSSINITMKNWAVLFIKNCCDSQKLRQQISKIKIQMKVQD